MLCSHDIHDSRASIPGFATLLSAGDRYSLSLATELAGRCDALLDGGRLASVGFPIRFGGVPWDLDVTRGEAGYRVTFRSTETTAKGEVYVPFLSMPAPVRTYGDGAAVQELLDILYGISVSCVPVDARRYPTPEDGN